MVLTLSLTSAFHVVAGVIARPPFCRRELQVLPIVLVHVGEQNVGPGTNGVGDLDPTLDRLQAGQAGLGRADRIVIVLVAEGRRYGQAAPHVDRDLELADLPLAIVEIELPHGDVVLCTAARGGLAAWIRPLEVTDEATVVIGVIMAVGERPARARQQPRPRLVIGKHLAAILVGYVGIRSRPIVLLVAVIGAEVPLSVWRPDQLAACILLGVRDREAVNRRIGRCLGAGEFYVSQDPVVEEELGRLVVEIVVAID